MFKVEKTTDTGADATWTEVGSLYATEDLAIAAAQTLAAAELLLNPAARVRVRASS